MKPVTTFVVLLLLCITKSFCQSPITNNRIAKKFIEASIAAMGGEAWKSVQSLSLEGYGYSNDIDQSERPEGPYTPSQFSRSILKDLSHGMFLVDQKTQDHFFSNESTYLFNNYASALKEGSKISPTLQGQQLYDELNLSPELILKKALVAPDLVFLKDTIYQQAGHRIFSFKFEGYPVRFFLNKETDLLTVVEITKPYKNEFYGIWGDIKKTTIYSFWMLLGKGLHYPVQQDTYINDWYKSSFIINKWVVNPTIKSDSLLIPGKIIEQDKLLAKNQEDGLKKQVEQGGKEIAPGIWFFHSLCNSTIIEQPDGIVVMESPYASFYGEALINKAKSLFPGKKIKALITTSDAWLHIGGVRAFAAIPDIKIYHPARNSFILNKLLHATYITEPDAFANTLKPTYDLIGITDTIAVGRGQNRLVMYAYKTETGDRMMMVYFPQYKMLYTSDLYQRKDKKGKYWNPQMVWEVYHSVEARKLEVKQFYAMHTLELIPFEDMINDYQTEMQ